MQLEKFTQDLFTNNEKYTLQRFPKKTSTEIRTTIDGKNWKATSNWYNGNLTEDELWGEIVSAPDPMEPGHKCKQNKGRKNQWLTEPYSRL